MSVDLHVHTTESDGTWTPQELVHQAVKRGIRTIAITDHDTTSGIRSAQTSAPEGLEVIPGIEINAAAPDGADVHIVGLWIDPENPTLQERLGLLREARIVRTEKILTELRALGIAITLDDVLKYAREDVISRSHIASVLLEEGVVSSKAEAFERLIGEGCPAYVPRFKVEPAEAVALIFKAGGVPVLAHPGLLANLDVLPILVEAGLVGLEVIHPSHDAAQTEFYMELARRCNLLPSGGSDCHGPGGKDQVFLGSYTIPEEWVLQLAARR
ncbi:MAG: PHP domain-containing protein [Limnochordia bacterium]